MHRHPSPGSFFWKQSIPGQFLLQLLLCRAVTTNDSCAAPHIYPSLVLGHHEPQQQHVGKDKHRTAALWPGKLLKASPTSIRSPNHPALFQFCSVLKTNLFSLTPEDYTLCMHYVLKVLGKNGPEEVWNFLCISDLGKKKKKKSHSQEAAACIQMLPS